VWILACDYWEVFFFRRATIEKFKWSSYSIICNLYFGKFISMHLFMMNSLMKWCDSMFVGTFHHCCSFLWPDYLMFVQIVALLLWQYESLNYFQLILSVAWLFDVCPNRCLIIWCLSKLMPCLYCLCSYVIVDWHIFSSDVPVLVLWRNPSHILSNYFVLYAG